MLREKKKETQNYALAESLKHNYVYVNASVLEIFIEKNLYATYEGKNHYNVFSSLILAKIRGVAVSENLTTVNRRAWVDFFI